MGREIKLARLIKTLEGARVNGDTGVVISGIQNDSRQVKRGDMFVATKGGQTDGLEFVDDALGKGAVAIVTDRPVPSGSASNIVVEDTVKALADLASAFYGSPSDELEIIGVTGTNGKTSTTHLLRSICEVSTWGSVGVIGTVGHGVGTTLESGVHTTPDPVTLHRLFREMKDTGCRGVVMEVSSHAVRQQRTWGVDFEIGMLTNVTRDHLDYHPTFDDYLSAKREFCYSLASSDRRKKQGILIYSKDNRHSNDIGEGFPGEKISTSAEGPADVFATGVKATIEGTFFDLHLRENEPIRIELRLLGSFSVSNALLAAAGAGVLGIDLKDIKTGLEAVERVPGRFEAIGGGGRPLVIVDYSHTPDSLERTLEFCLGLDPDRLITVFGCGGDRDRGKRPLMGAIAQKSSHICYVTSDNPRSENPDRIIEDILAGMELEQREVVVEADRRTAIAAAIRSAGGGDLVVICGKGHEDYQIIGTTRHHFDDREEAEIALKEWEDK
ncbi:MAG: UDP-N-acetylmuramoyl-L-alanyl-D-glutamate--2,6-diaminopimelate ligase [Candidatus Latescibacterota bacterium]|nr:MAG: UDP-N-acetylmuramoyl-L-alanyl-D-glutamate--2,6-diaminopimelate ligase [Candidatus Latescibacterota bacterium]